MTNSSKSDITRRGFLGLTGAAGIAGLTACSSGLASSSAPAASTGSSGGTIKIGYVSPETGPLSIFGQSNSYVLGQVRAALAKGLTIGG